MPKDRSVGDLNDLGEPLQTHPTRKMMKVIFVGLGIMILGIGLTLVIAGGKISDPTIAKTAPWTGGFLVLLGPILALVGVFSPAPTYVIYESGLAEKRGRKTSFYAWSDVKFVYHNYHPRKLYWITFADGKQIKLDWDIVNVSGLGSAIKSHVATIHQTAAEKELSQGGSVDFDILRVSETGISWNKDDPPPMRRLHNAWLGFPHLHKGVEIRWAEIAKITAGRDMAFAYGIAIRTKADGCWFETDVQNIPNLELFEELIRQLKPRVLPQSLTAEA